MHIVSKSLDIKRNLTFWNTYGVLDTASRLTEQLRLGVVHFRGVENLLTFYLVQVQGAAEPQGG